uniref:DDE-1 domain-containing protein n=1 Tax=Hyaloperonospora arabidopsidis (strain Emoy2) TaxID=559515 RepID=M4C464_HYAAE
MIETFKPIYRCDSVLWSLDQHEQGDSAKKLNLLTAVCKIVKVWEALTLDTIRTASSTRATSTRRKRQHSDRRSSLSVLRKFLPRRAHPEAVSVDNHLPADAYIA